MKKIFALTILAMFAFVVTPSFAQQAGASTALVSLDSSLSNPHVANTGSVTMYCKVANAWDVASVQFVETKSTGTTAGTCFLVGSNDGVNFVPISRASIAATALRPAYTDTLTSTNQTTNTKTWILSNGTYTDGSTPVAFPYLYIGVKKTGSGTMNSTLKAVAVFKHK